MLRISWTTENLITGGGGDLELSETEHVLQFDAVTQVSHEHGATVTEHAVERGSVLSDHKRAEPDRVSITATVTNTPIGAPPPSGFTDGGPIQASEGTNEAKINALQFSRPFDRMVSCLATLRRLTNEPILVTVATRSATYEEMTVISCTGLREADSGDSLEFTVELQRLRLAYTETVEAPVPREARGGLNRNAGDQEAENAGDSAGGQSMAAGLLDAVPQEYRDQAADVLGSLFGGA